jgi:hypothetical protein
VIDGIRRFTAFSKPRGERMRNLRERERKLMMEKGKFTLNERIESFFGRKNGENLSLFFISKLLIKFTK